MFCRGHRTSNQMFGNWNTWIQASSVFYRCNTTQYKTAASWFYSCYSRSELLLLLLWTVVTVVVNCCYCCCELLLLLQTVVVNFIHAGYDSMVTSCTVTYCFTSTWNLLHLYRVNRILWKWAEYLFICIEVFTW